MAKRNKHDTMSVLITKPLSQMLKLPAGQVDMAAV